MNIEEVKIWLIAHDYATCGEAFAGKCVFFTDIIYVLILIAAGMDGSAVLQLIEEPYGIDLLVGLLPLASTGDCEKLIRDLRENSEVKFQW